MEFIEIFEKKKRGLELSDKEIDFVVQSFDLGRISNDNMIEFMKIINQNNFNYKETYYFANAIAKTGELINISDKVGYVIDKHSVGMYSDVSTLIFMSVLATIGLKNVKVLSGEYGEFRNSLDRFKVFKNFDAKISHERLAEIINKTNAGVIEETGQIAPVDKKLYKLRKQENIVSVPLIASSILAKKIATGTKAIIYDVKAGEGAFATDAKTASILAEYLVESSKLAGLDVAAVITNLDQPLGSSLGIRAEIEEMIVALRSERSLFEARLIDVARELVIVALCLTKVANGRSEASNMFEEAILSGKALDKFREIIKEYGAVYEDFKHSAQTLLDGVAISYITAQESGYVHDINIQGLIGGYETLSLQDNNKIDKNAGVVLLIKEGSKVNFGDKLARVFYSFDNKQFFRAINPILDSIKISKSKPSVYKIFYKVVL